MLKKTAICAITVITLLASPSNSRAAEGISVYLDGKNMEFDQDPQLIKGSTMVPMRAIFEELGAQVKWDSNSSSVTATKGNITIKLTIGKKEVLKNGDVFNVSVEPTILNSTTYVPLRFVSESLGTNVGWIKEPNTVIINSAKLQEFKVEHIRDGDTFEGIYKDGPKKGQKDVIRLIGVDTPETVKEGSAVEYWGPEASNYTKKSLSQQTVFIAEDKSDDPYGRTLAYVFLENGLMYNADLVAGGYARELTIEPNSKWKDLFSHLEAEAKSSARGLWSKPSKESENNTQTNINYLKEKASEYGFIDGEFDPKEVVTEEQLLKFLIIALFPEAKAIFLTKSFYDLSQNEKVQKTIDYAIEAGLILKDEISDIDEPLTLSSAAKITSRALQLEEIDQELSLLDFGINFDQTDSSSSLTLGDTILLVEKTARVHDSLKEYFRHMAVAVENSEIVEQLSATLADKQLAEKLKSYVANVKGVISDPELIATVTEGGSQLIGNLTSLLSGWKDAMNINKINAAIEQTSESIKKAEQALEAAKLLN
ncbi:MULTISPECIES: stalk domain-containing protein [unclassified Paenibacillus]|uniref:Stalk domain-containing protein n=2 Tax=Bacteria TaxID=2 RepID=A0ABW3Q3N2_9BACL|nr:MULTISPECIES: stalk domain-containing protein [unclassified Paenibacillus]MCM3130616.1 stalk domain-containing protein [Paenibacillus sp. MER 78]SDX74407.1 Endonuclease YncB, thermonuclease family [Paenibacillus sp. PDC88]SFS89782.1 Endonuclease YncB, thermonuclease family [Paenibacillus sp. 453mf]